MFLWILIWDHWVFHFPIDLFRSRRTLIVLDWLARSWIVCLTFKVDVGSVVRSSYFHRLVFKFQWFRVFSWIFCLKWLSNCVNFLLFQLWNFRPMHFFNKFCIILRFFLRLMCFISLFIFLKLFLFIFLKNMTKKFTSKSHFILFCFLIKIWIIVFSLLSKL